MNRLWIVIAVAAVAALAADVVLDASRIGFTALIGFAGCALLIIGAKGLGNRWLSRPEDYYAQLAERTSAAEDKEDSGA